MTILELHKFVFDLMEDIRYSLDKSGNSFVYGLRQRDQNRINGGYLFAGNDNYLSIKLSCESCDNNRTSTVYLSIRPNCYSKLVIVYDKTSKFSQFYDNLANNLNINPVQTNQYKVTYEYEITSKGTTDLVLRQSIRDFLINNYNKLIRPLVNAKLDVDFMILIIIKLKIIYRVIRPILLRVQRLILLGKQQQKRLICIRIICL